MLELFELGFKVRVSVSGLSLALLPRRASLGHPRAQVHRGSSGCGAGGGGSGSGAGGGRGIKVNGLSIKAVTATLMNLVL